MFEMAVTTSSVNSPMRASVSIGRGSAVSDAAIIAPHSRPSTMIGVATAERMPSSRVRSPMGPEASS